MRRRDRTAQPLRVLHYSSAVNTLVVFAMAYGAHPMPLGLGEAQATLAALAWVAAALLSRRFLRRVPLGIFMVVRTALGTVVFFAVVIYLFGVEHFQDVFSPFLWQWMLVYGGIIVVAGQFCWFRGIAVTRASQTCLANSRAPVAGVIFAVLLVGERPNTAVLVGGGIIVLGIAVAQLGPIVARRATRHATPTTDEAVKLESGITFKGV